MILIDANSLIVLLIGLIDTGLFKTHNATSIYEEEDFDDLLSVIGSIDKLIVLPNVWTETDNKLNKFGGRYKDRYVEQVTNTIKATTEKYLESIRSTQSIGFYDLGLTDSLLLEYGKECSLLITSDSTLSDYAIASNIKVYDMKKIRNDRL